MFQTILTSIAMAGAFFGTGLSGANESQEDPRRNIVEVAAEAGSFSTLITAVKAAGLVETLSGEGPFTVFAPTDEAFAKIPESDLAALLADEEALTAVLTYHVVSGEVYAKDVMELSSAKTVNGQEVTVKVQDGTVMIDDASVVSADIQASNGVIHVIDRVILPEM
jgi:uncharacterized surface protein with fasciclin (FAS1) repeats